LDHVDLGKVVSRFNQQYEGVSVDVRTIGVPAQLAAIRDGDLDIGFVRPPVTDPSLRSEVLLREPLVVALPAKHRLAAKDPVPLSALAAESFVLPARTVAPVYYHLVLRVCREAGFVPHSTHEADNLPLMLGMVASGGEVALVHLSGRKFGVGGVTFTSLRPPPPPLETAIAWRAENSSPAIEGFVKTARDLLGGPRNRPGRKA
jgi:DNA-binding transcriptional LysR family regulator